MPPNLSPLSSSSLEARTTNSQPCPAAFPFWALSSLASTGWETDQEPGTGTQPRGGPVMLLNAPGPLLILSTARPLSARCQTPGRECAPKPHARPRERGAAAAILVRRRDSRGTCVAVHAWRRAGGGRHLGPMALKGLCPLVVVFHRASSTGGGSHTFV